MFNFVFMFDVLGNILLFFEFDGCCLSVIECVCIDGFIEMFGFGLWLGYWLY